jgi:hypothetical protein
LFYALDKQISECEVFLDKYNLLFINFLSIREWIAVTGFMEVLWQVDPD